MSHAEWIRVFLLGMLVALVGCLVVTRSDGRAYAEAAAERGGLMAVASSDRLFLIDTGGKQIAAYMDDGTGFHLRGARYYAHDFSIYDLYDRRIVGNNIRLTVKDAIEATKAYATLGEMVGTIRMAQGLCFDPYERIAAPDCLALV